MQLKTPPAAPETKGGDNQNTAGFKVPPGFTVTQYAGPELANDIYCLHIDARGRMMVGGPGYVRQFFEFDLKDSPVYAINLVTGLKHGPMGLLREDDTLFVVTDGGLLKFSNCNTVKPVTAGTKVLALKTGEEHGAHAIRRGPDGFLYWLGGNTAGVNKAMIRGTTSPISDPVAGCLLRMNDDASQVEVIADGFRNPYDFDFDPNGEPFTFDSDNERCVGLPWYEPTRFYHIAPGMTHGWRNPQRGDLWRRPAYFFDVAKPVCTLGRGSPTGVACYRHAAFPTKYHGGFFLADWTFGKIWFVKPARDGDNYRGEPELFLEATGSAGFAPTGLAVDPIRGDLFVSIGGRGTRGAVYRIHADTPTANATSSPMVAKRNTTVRTTALPIPVAGTPLTLERMRAWQIKLGDFGNTPGAFEGYTLRNAIDPDDARRLLAELRMALAASDGTDTPFDREITRTLAALHDADPAGVREVLRRLTPKSDPVFDVHNLIVLSLLTGPRTEAETQATAAVLIRLDAKYESASLTRDRHWPLRMNEVGKAMTQRDPKLAEALVHDANFGQSSHGWLTTWPGIERVAAARRFVATAAKSADYAWSPQTVELLDSLPAADVRPILASIWGRGGVEDAVIRLLAKQPIEADRVKLRRGLKSADRRAIVASARGLAKLGGQDPADIAALIVASRKAGTETEPRSALNETLGLLTGVTTTDWPAWAGKSQPEVAKLLAAASSPSAAAWQKRAEKIDFVTGDATRGAKVFSKMNCAACHNGNTAVGPSLEGVAKRFSVADLFTAIVDPSKDVPTRYRLTKVTTTAGKSYEGIIVYDAVDALMLQTSATEMVRLSAAGIESRSTKDGSLMPEGLLDEATDGDVADLVAYLRTLGR